MCQADEHPLSHGATDIKVYPDQSHKDFLDPALLLSFPCLFNIFGPLRESFGLLSDEFVLCDTNRTYPISQVCKMVRCR